MKVIPDISVDSRGVQWAEHINLNSLQSLENKRFHRWYRFVLAYSDRLVLDLIGRYEVGGKSLVLDPFCGTGTTLVAAKTAGIPSVGIDANPVSAYASSVKTCWDVEPARVSEAAVNVVRRFRPFSKAYLPGTAADPLLLRDLRDYMRGSQVEPRLDYFEKAGMLERRWMHELPMLQSFTMMHLIETGRADDGVKKLLRLLLVSAIQESVSNVAYGPELFVKSAKLMQPKDLERAFMEKVTQAIEDLRDAPPAASCSAYQMDGRNPDERLSQGCFSHIITSPPYPTEKDYTRNSRLELVFLGFVTDTESLRRVKREMIRSHSKGIYKGDDDGSCVTDIESVQAVARELEEKVETKTYGFAKLYPKIIREYFGGMRRHLRAVKPLMADGGIAAYVLGEQATYLQTYTPTARILAEIAQLEGFEVKEILPFRTRTGTTGGGRRIREEVLVLRN